jgi:hypothetical protein
VAGLLLGALTLRLPAGAVQRHHIVRQLLTALLQLAHVGVDLRRGHAECIRNAALAHLLPAQLRHPLQPGGRGGTQHLQIREQVGAQRLPAGRARPVAEQFRGAAVIQPGHVLVQRAQLAAHPRQGQLRTLPGQLRERAAVRAGRAHDSSRKDTE